MKPFPDHLLAAGWMDRSAKIFCGIGIRMDMHICNDAGLINPLKSLVIKAKLANLCRHK